MLLIIIIIITITEELTNRLLEFVNSDAGMEDLRHTHPNLFISQIDNAFRYSILHSMLVMERADQDMIDCAFNLMKKEMERHSENYRTPDDLLEEGGVDI